MASPADTLTSLRDALLNLHRELLQSERAAYEQDVQPIRGPGHMLNLLLEDPWFAYLRELSQFVVAVDELLDSKDEEATERHVDEFLAKAKALLVPAEEGAGFGRRYYEAMQRDPDVIIAHGRTAKLIAALR